MKSLLVGGVLLAAGLGVIIGDRLPDGHIETNTLIFGGAFALTGAFLLTPENMKDAIKALGAFVPWRKDDKP